MVEISTKKKSSCSAGACFLYLVYFSVLAAVAVIALDGLEYVSLGIVKDVLKMKVLSMEDFDKLNSDLEEAKKSLEEMTTAKDTASAEAATNLSNYNTLKTEKSKVDLAVQSMGREKTTLQTEKNQLTAKVAELEKERDELKAKVEAAEAAAAAAANKEDGEEKKED